VGGIDGEVFEIMTGVRVVIIGLICFVAAAALFTVPWARRGEEESPPPIEAEADVTARNIHLVGDSSGVKGWELDAREARHFLGGKTTMLEGIEAAFYIENGGVIRLKGDHGEIHHGTRDIELQGNIVILTSDGYRLMTDGLQYVDKARQITSSQRVDIEGQGLQVMGKGMSIDLATGRLTMGGRVETVFSESLKGPTSIVPGWKP
jgi:LPS export ABC transporter protein LptC